MGILGNMTSGVRLAGIWGGWVATSCPDGEDNVTVPIFVTVVWSITVILAIAFAVVTFLKFNSVDVFGKRVRTRHISNNFWILYFAMSAVRSTVDVLRFDYQPINGGSAVFDAYMVCDAIAMSSLLYALNFQRKHRSRKSSIEEKPARQINGAGASGSRCILQKDTTWWSEAFIGVVFIGYVAVSVTSCIITSNMALHWVLFGYVILARALIVMNGLFIFFKMHRLSRRSRLDVVDDGPSLGTRVCLLFAVFLSALIDLPPSIWHQILPDECTFYIATPYDALQLLKLASLVLYFAVVRNEFKRNMEECIWTTVS